MASSLNRGKNEAYDNAKRRFEDILERLPDTVSIIPVLEVEHKHFTLFGYVINGSLVINQIFKDKDRPTSVLLLADNQITWAGSEENLRKHLGI